MEKSSLTPIAIKHQIIYIAGFPERHFHVQAAQDLDGESWSLMGHWLDEGNVEPEVPIVEHIMIPAELIVLCPR